jgi:hypothetical protein
MSPKLDAGLRTCLLSLALGLLGASLGITAPVDKGNAAAVLSGRTEFNRDIRPLFAKHCTACHGGVKAAGGLSFLYRERALAQGKSGEVAIVPGAPDKSEVIRRVTSQDPDELMPKPGHGPRLTAAEIGKLRQWIQEGAQWSEHWSFVPPVEPPTPAVKNKSWPRSKADALILAHLESEGLKPSPEAAPGEWLRRVTFDLIGLPPKLEEFDAFQADWKKNPRSAREKVVDRLLASPRFGERWAAMWLDLARYSDTYGYEKDPHRDIWPWRDWVIRAFNTDMPFDQFTIKQLAGDLLDNPTADDLLATAFHRNTQNNTEGGTDDEEFRTVAVVDRVNTTWTVWQATTFGCLQCHSHPYDPFPQRDYYRFAAFFNNTEDCDQNDDYPRLVFPTNMSVRDEGLRLQLDAARRRTELNDSALKVAAGGTDWKRIVPLETKASGGKLTAAPDGLMTAGGTLPVAVKYTLKLAAVEGLTAIRFDIFPESAVSNRPPERGQIFSKLTASLAVAGASNQPVRLKEMVADYLTGPRDPRKVLEGEGGFGSYPVMAGPRWGFVVLEKPLAAPEGAILELVLEHGIASNSGFQGCPLKHFALSGTTDSRLTDFVNSPGRMEAWKEWRATRERLKEFPGTSVPVLSERPSLAKRETRVFIRGNRLSLDEAVAPGIPDVVRPPRVSGGLTRLDLAKWLVGEQNPLAARVLANRLWAEMFGHGIVETLEDFGTSGAKPTHPELLDHLALRLRGDLRWSVKAFLREIALSGTYGQSSRATGKLLEIDFKNQLYTRGPRTRLSAEMVRDQSLAISGVLSEKSFGPPVYPPQPDGIWANVYNGEKWNTSKGEDRYRRGIYTYARRTSGYPMFLTFDAPMRDTCTARRMPSNTPLQALTVLNDPAFLEMAEALATRMEKEGGGSPRQKIELACRWVTLDPPPRPMVESLMKLYERARQDLQADSKSSDKIATTPEKAALVLVANTLLNLDVSLTR